MSRICLYLYGVSLDALANTHTQIHTEYLLTTISTRINILEYVYFTAASIIIYVFD